MLYPFVDGTILTQTPGAAFASGQFNQVPVISGGNHDEYRLFVADDFDAQGSPLTNAEYAAATAAVFDGFAPFVLGEYPLPVSPPADAASLTLGESGTDGIFACPERNGVQLLSKYVTTYAYELNDENAYLIFNEFPGVTLSFPLGAAHFTEVPYLFVRLRHSQRLLAARAGVTLRGHDQLLDSLCRDRQSELGSDADVDAVRFDERSVPVVHTARPGGRTERQLRQRPPLFHLLEFTLTVGIHSDWHWGAAMTTIS